MTRLTLDSRRAVRRLPEIVIPCHCLTSFSPAPPAHHGQACRGHRVGDRRQSRDLRVAAESGGRSDQAGRGRVLIRGDPCNDRYRWWTTSTASGTGRPAMQKEAAMGPGENDPGTGRRGGPWDGHPGHRREAKFGWSDLPQLLRSDALIAMRQTWLSIDLLARHEGSAPSLCPVNPVNPFSGMR